MSFFAPIDSSTTKDVESKAMFLKFQNAPSVRSGFQDSVQSIDGKLDQHHMSNHLASLNQQHVQQLQLPTSNLGYKTKPGLLSKDIKLQHHTHAKNSSCATKYDD